MALCVKMLLIECRPRIWAHVPAFFKHIELVLETARRWEVLQLRIALVIVQYIVCLTLIVSVLLQPGKSAGLSGSIAGGAEQLFGKKVSKGYEALFSKITTMSAILFMALSIVLVLVK